jgi:hypothetical protein
VIGVLVNFINESGDIKMVDVQNGNLQSVIAEAAMALNIDINSFIDDKGTFNINEFMKTVDDLTAG